MILVHAPVTLCAEKLQKNVCGTQAREKSTAECFNEIEVKKNGKKMMKMYRKIENLTHKYTAMAFPTKTWI